ncbi:MAG: hypothetical protein QGI83_09545 [Candidatus Latescibacteria bacterium]|jgi:hypothetical protein|nr:hypothetical protein [Candidatus Latescibacterota bacterium]
MDWLPILIVLAHLLIGLFCGHLAYAARLKADSWFLAGALLGGFALIAFCLRNHLKRFSRPTKYFVTGKARPSW